MGIFNFAKKLKGFQIGFLNYAGNNPKWLRLLPLMNVHLR
ncbi:MAG: LA_2272 family surface repeat-containing protein [bacterium]